MAKVEKSRPLGMKPATSYDPLARLREWAAWLQNNPIEGMPWMLPSELAQLANEWEAERKKRENG